MMWCCQSFLRSILIVISCVLLSEAAVARNNVEHAASDHLVFGVAPFMSPMALVKRMAPLRDYLSDSLGVQVLIETATDAKDFAQRTLDGRYDFVLTNPTFSLMAMDHGGFQIVATQKKKLSGHFVVLESSSIRNIKELSGKHIGAPPKVGLMGQLIYPYLSNNIFTKTKMPEITYFHSHNDAISALRLGDTEATLIVSFMEKHLRAKGLPIRTIYRTETYPGMTVLASQKMAKEHVNKLRMSLYELDQRKIGMKILKKTSMSGYQKLDIKELELVRAYLPSKGIK